MTIDNIIEVNEIYIWRRQQIIDLWKKVDSKIESDGIVTIAKNIDQAEVMAMGFFNRHKALLSRLDELDNDYLKVYQISKSFWYSVFGWMPFIKVNNKTVNDFISKWNSYHPGW